MNKCKLYVIAFLLGILTFYLLKNKKNVEGLDINNPDAVASAVFNELTLKGLGTDIGENPSINSSGRIDTNKRNGPIRLTVKGKFERGKIIDVLDNNLNANPQYVLSILKQHIQTSPSIKNIRMELNSIEEIYDDTITIDFTILGLSSHYNIPEILRGNVGHQHRDGINPLEFNNGYYILGDNPKIRIDYGSSEYIYEWIKPSQVDSTIMQQLTNTFNLPTLL